MAIPTLAQLAQNAVAKHISKGHYNRVDYQLDTKTSNEIFQALLKYSCRYPVELHEQFQKKFILSNIDVEMYPFEGEIRELAKSQDLKSFSFFATKCCGTYNIVECLEKSLNPNTMNQLKQLTIGTNVSFPLGWAKTVGQMLPELESFSVNMSPILDRDFMFIFLYFPNLKVLDLGRSGLTALHGISNLTNLEVLILNDLKLETPAALNPIFGCTRLRMLDVSKEDPSSGPKIMENYLRCGRVLRNLQFLDCSGTDIDLSMIKSLMETHGNLRKVAVLDTILNYSIIPGIVLLNSATPESIANSFEHYIALKKDDYVVWMLSEVIAPFIEEQGDFRDTTLYGTFLQMICKAMDVFKPIPKCYKFAIKCLGLLVRDSNMHHFKTENLVWMIHSLVDAGNRWFQSEFFKKSHSNIWRIVHKRKLLQLPGLDVLKLSKYSLKCIGVFKRNPEISYELDALPCLVSRLQGREIEEFLSIDYLWECMWAILNFFHKQNEAFVVHFRHEVAMALSVTHELTKRNDSACQNILAYQSENTNTVKTLVQIFEFQCFNDQDRTTALQIIINLMRTSELREKLEDCLLERCSFFIDTFDSLTWNYANPNRIFCTMTILSILMRRGVKINDEFDELMSWKDVNMKMVKACRSIQSNHITLDLDIYANFSILKTVFLNAEHDGPVMWALLTMKAMLRRDKEFRREIIKSKLHVVVEKLQWKEPGVLALRAGVLKMLYNSK